MVPEENTYNMDVIKNPLMPPLKRNYHLENEVDNLQNRLNLNMNTVVFEIPKAIAMSRSLYFFKLYIKFCI